MDIYLGHPEGTMLGFAMVHAAKICHRLYVCGACKIYIIISHMRFRVNLHVVVA